MKQTKMGAQQMSHKVFIPVTDEMLYDYPELITAPLRPYQIDNPCYHWMATIESSDQDEQGQNGKVRHFNHRMNLNRRDTVPGRELVQTGSRLA